MLKKYDTTAEYLKNKLKGNQKIYSLVKNWIPDVQRLIAKYLPAGAFIIQIGSNDGKTGDPIYELFQKNRLWRGLFVEPVPYLYKRLIENYGSDPRYVFEMSVINGGEEAFFYYIREEAKMKLPDLPNWFDQLGSFKRENITNHLQGVLEPYIEEVKMKGLTLKDLLNKHKVEVLDFLHTYTEGYDWEVIKQLPLDLYKPSVVLFEHKHLSDIDKKSCLHYLKEDYCVYQFGGDCLCVRKDKLSYVDYILLMHKRVT